MAVKPLVLITPRSFIIHGRRAIDRMKREGLHIELNSFGRPLTEKELVERIGEAVGVIVGVDPLPARVLEQASKLVVISKYGAGIDNIDVAAASKLGIVVTRLPGANAEAVADHAFALLLAVARRVGEADRAMRQGQWGRFVGRQVSGRCLGLVGTGRIGRAVLKRAKGFDMQIVCFDKQPDPAMEETYGVRYLALDDLLQQADFISLHVPLTRETKGMIGRRELALMKPSSILINTARGGLVDESALAEALKAGQLAGAGLDVYEKEPLRDSPLVGLEQVILTPHIGAYTQESLEKMADMAVDNLLRALNEEMPADTVNAVEIDRCGKEARLRQRK